MLLKEIWGLAFLMRILCDEKINGVIRDFFRTGLTAYAPEQVSIVLKRNCNDINNLSKSILDIIKQGRDIIAGPDFSSIYCDFEKKLKYLKQFTPSVSLCDDFEKIAPYYNKTMQKGIIKKSLIRSVYTFADIISKETWSYEDVNTLLGECSEVLRVLSADNRNKKKEHYSLPFFEKAVELLLPLIESATSYHKILIRMASDCKQMLDHFFLEEEIFTHDQILRTMERKLQNECFLESIRSRFDVALIDEFQDTDPIQWNIFNKISYTRQKTARLCLLSWRS